MARSRGNSASSTFYIMAPRTPSTPFSKADDLYILEQWHKNKISNKSGFLKLYKSSAIHYSPLWKVMVLRSVTAQE